MSRYRRLLAILRTFRDHAAGLNRRAAVEQEMWHCVNGKQPMPDKEKLRDWALRLGVPDEFRTREK